MRFRTALGIAIVAFAFSLPPAMPSFAQAPAAGTPQAEPPPPSVPVQPAPVQSGDPFGEEVTLEARPIVSVKGNATWETAFETLTSALKTVSSYLDKTGAKAAGSALVIYTQTDDTGFQFEAGMPVASEVKAPPKGDLSLGKTPAGKMLKFVHRGSYDSMDTTYEAITNYLDEKQLEAKDMFIEEYVTDPLKTSEDQLVVNVYVPLK
jgi:effector-binding domain-containing protein